MTKAAERQTAPRQVVDAQRVETYGPPTAYISMLRGGQGP